VNWATTQLAGGKDIRVVNEDLNAKEMMDNPDVSSRNFVLFPIRDNDVSFVYFRLQCTKRGH
jgi:hypothetical protein